MDNDFEAFFFTVEAAERGADIYTAHRHLRTYPDFYPPFLLSVLKGVTWLPLEKAFFVWNLVQGLLLIAIYIGIALIMGRLRLPFGSFLAAAVILSFLWFVQHNFRWGQVNVLTTFFIVMFIFFLLDGRHFISGFMLGAAVSIKLTPVVFVLLVTAFRLKEAHRFLGGFVASLVLALVILPGAVFGFSWALETNLHFWQLMLSVARHGTKALAWGDNCANGSLMYAMHTWFGKCSEGSRVLSDETISTLDKALQYLMLFFSAACSASLFFRADRVRLGLAVVVLSLAAVLMSPVLWSHHLVLLIPGAAILMGLGLFGSLSWTPRLLLICSAAFVFSTLLFGSKLDPLTGRLAPSLLAAFLFASSSLLHLQMHHPLPGRVLSSDG